MTALSGAIGGLHGPGAVTDGYIGVSASWRKMQTPRANVSSRRSAEVSASIGGRDGGASQDRWFYRLSALDALH